MATTVRKIEIARRAGVSPAAVSKACDRGWLVVDAEGMIDPDHATNVRWLSLHSEGYDSRGRAMSTHSRAGRPKPMSATAAEKGRRPSTMAGRHGRPAAASFSEADLDGLIGADAYKPAFTDSELDELFTSSLRSLGGGSSDPDDLTARFEALEAAVLEMGKAMLGADITFPKIVKGLADLRAAAAAADARSLPEGRSDGATEEG
jgi:hypothetical protein